MKGQDVKRIRNILRYNVLRQYFGAWDFSEVYAAYKKVTDALKYGRETKGEYIKIGKIDSDVICNVLWYEMSFNPVRFGTVSPFKFIKQSDGVPYNNIYKFCEKYKSQTPVCEFIDHRFVLKDYQKKLHADSTDATVKNLIADFLWAFMLKNKASNGAWCAEITPANGIVCITHTDGRMNNMYKMLGYLRDCIKLIAWQNVQDFYKVRGPYCSEIVKNIIAKFPKGFRARTFFGTNSDVSDTSVVPDKSIGRVAVSVPQIVENYDIEIEKLEEKIERLENVMISADYRNLVEIRQIQNDCEKYKQRLQELQNRHSK